MKLPDLSFESQLWEKGYTVIGIDEVGRGAFAGPLYVAGVIFPPLMNKNRRSKLLSYGIKDSKKLTPNVRKTLSKVIQSESLSYHISTVSVRIINRIGIGKATFLAMRNVVKNLRENQQNVSKTQDLRTNNRIFVLVYGFNIRYLKWVGLENQLAIIGGDNIALSIAAASIIAKVARDNHMENLSANYPEYKWDKNKGYGTLFHRTAIQKFGPTPAHRTVFIKIYIDLSTIPGL